jgi:hypothetical protein
VKSFKIAICLLLFISISACTFQKRLYRNGYSLHWNAKSEISKIDLTNDEIDHSASQLKLLDNSALASSSREINLVDENQLFDLKSNINALDFKFEESIDSSKCDLILFKNGDEISAKVLEITPTEVKYKRCDNIEGPTNTVNKSSIFSITYVNGSKEIIKTEKIVDNNSNINANNTVNKKKGLAIASLVLGILGFFFGGGLLALIFGATQLSLIRKHPDTFGGKGMAVTGVVLGIIGIAFLLTVLVILTIL